MKRIAITQSNYLPWKGYFDLINIVDEFIIGDDVQYTKGDWRNRNRIKTRNGARWITIPIKSKGKYEQKINDAIISDPEWKYKHWDAIVHNYSKAKYFKNYNNFFEDLFLNTKSKFLSQINYRFLSAICNLLGIHTKISSSSEYHIAKGKTERLAEICKQAGATFYYSGKKAIAYLDETLFDSAGIKVKWLDYEGYPVYKQLFCPPFIHEVSIIDLIMNEGIEGAKRLMLSFENIKYE